MTTKHDESRVYRSLKFYEEDEEVFRGILEDKPDDEGARLVCTSFDAYFHGKEEPEIRDDDDRMMRMELKRLHKKALAQRKEDSEKIAKKRQAGERGGRPPRGKSDDLDGP